MLFLFVHSQTGFNFVKEIIKWKRNLFTYHWDDMKTCPIWYKEWYKAQSTANRKELQNFCETKLQN